MPLIQTLKNLYMNLDDFFIILNQFKYNVESDKRRKQPFYKNAFFYLFNH